MSFLTKRVSALYPDLTLFYGLRIWVESAWPWEGPGDEGESIRLRRKSITHCDGGNQETYRQMILAVDVQVGRVLEVLSGERASQQYHRHLHQRQWRRAVR
jgi:hypothetical protein